MQAFVLKISAKKCTLVNLLYANVPFLEHIFISYIFIIKNIFSHLKQFNMF